MILFLPLLPDGSREKILPISARIPCFKDFNIKSTPFQSLKSVAQGKVENDIRRGVVFNIFR
jgi:hypothetical protein